MLSDFPQIDITSVTFIIIIIIIIILVLFLFFSFPSSFGVRNFWFTYHTKEKYSPDITR